MAKITVITGIILILIGVVGYMGSDPASSDKGATETAAETADSGDEAKAEKKGKSITALIPAIVGGLLALCGVAAMNEANRKHAMHAAATIALLGFLAGAGRGGMGIGKFMSGDPSLNQRSFLFVWLMAIVCAVFLFLCVQSFRNARKQSKMDADSQAVS